ncbi:Dph6-related ATP pyrophosphatase [Hanstruepera flava]|uniref:Dph6-related ATP pyrophosphatase n=1 Tax=Hanstruepera flava TaxID=2930218 RepID=UPI002027831C|nr:ATP-binding protein [Hanstruepera flava]
MHKTYFNWSTGKDSALALYYLLKNRHYKVERLITTINGSNNRVSMHGLPLSLLEKQVTSIKIPAHQIKLPEQVSIQDYNCIMQAEVKKLNNCGFTHAAFGDIFLEDLRAYREQQLAKEHVEAIFPLWNKNTKQLIQDFFDLGFKAVIVSADANYFSEDFVGKTLTQSLIDSLPKTVDPCGENGEFHTFCYDGPIFSNPIAFKIGKKTYREYAKPNTSSETSGFWFCDLIPK